jgi:DNA polymerase I
MPSFITTAQLELMQELGRTRAPEAVCTRLQSFLGRLQQGAIDPEELAIRNRVSKRVEEYTHSTRNVAALERANDAGVEKAPGQDVEYVVVDDDKRGRDRVMLLHEGPETYDADFYEEQLIRATESLLAPLGVREADIRTRLAARTNASLSRYC